VSDYPHPKCDEACHYVCTEGGAHAPSCRTVRPTRSLLEGGEYIPSHRTCIADRFKRIAQERERAAFENVTQMRSRKP
jgi:hypothetical protein